ncbi:MAG: FAD-binding protein, partial [Thermoplasmata archaeon]
LDSARLARAGAASGVYVPLPQLPTDSRSAATAFGAALDHRPRAAAGLFLSDAFGREVAGQVAASRSLGLTGDAVGVELETGDRIVWSKPSFGGRTIAGIVSRTRPSLATVRPGAWEEETGGGRSTGIVWSTLPPAPASVRLLPFESGTEVGVGARGLEESEVVVAVGMGVGGPAGVAALTPLLDRWRAALGATRRVVDAGWVPRQFQIGLTGRAPAPRLGVLLGVGGSPNHLVAWRRAHTVLAVNRDPDAPVFRDVDVGIVGTLEEIVPLLGEALAPLLDV